jgi:hypothetical protein
LVLEFREIGTAEARFSVQLFSDSGFSFLFHKSAYHLGNASSAFLLSQKSKPEKFSHTFARGGILSAS